MGVVAQRNACEMDRAFPKLKGNRHFANLILRTNSWNGRTPEIRVPDIRHRNVPEKGRIPLANWSSWSVPGGSLLELTAE
jgi:hypothetical protein